MLGILHMLIWSHRYANNQWNLAAELVDDLEQTAFRKALAHSEGTLSVLDSEGVTYTRTR